MVWGDPEAVDAARRAVQHVRRAAQQAERAALNAATAAERHERLLAEGSDGMADLHSRMAVISRHSAASQQRAATLLLSFAQQLERWAAPEDAAALLRPVLMGEVAHAAGWGGAVLTLRDRSGGESLVAASSTTARRAHEMQVALREGPAVEALHGRASIARGAGLRRRWPRFGREVGSLGVAAAAAVPLHVGSRWVFGSLSAIGPPTPAPPGDVAGLRTMADALNEGILLASHAVRDTYRDVPSLELFETEDFQPALHQAAGVLHERGDGTVDDAITLIRTRAHAEGRPVAEVAEDLLRRRIPPPGAKRVLGKERGEPRDGTSAEEYRP